MNTFHRFVQDSHGDRKYTSVVTAKVTKIQDDGLYEIQYLATVDPTVQADARVMALMAGAGRGVFMQPQPGDEVVVAFEDGNPNQPIILGGVWNRESPVPGQASQSTDNNIRTIVSRSGHELTFDDSPGSEKVTLRAKSGPQVVLDAHAVTIHSGASTITVDATGSITIQGARITLSGATVAISGALTVNGVPYTMHVHGGGTLPFGLTGPVTTP